MGAAPPLSVVLPVRNGGDYFREALASIEAQTFGDYELLIQDDGSTDETRDVALDLARRDARVAVESRPGAGVASAANRATSRARAPLVLRMDADDVAHPERFEQQIAFAEANPDVGMFGSRVEYFPRDVLGEGMRHYERWLNGLLTHEAIFADRFVEYPIPHPTTVVRAEVFRTVGGFRDGDFPEDYDFFLRAAAAGVRFGKHPDVLLEWRHGDHRTTGRDPRYGLDRFRALKIGHLAPVLAGRKVVLVGAGRAGRQWADALAEAGTPAAAFADDHPARVGQQIRGLPVVELSKARLEDTLVFVTLGSGRRDEVRERLEHAGVAVLCVQ